MAKVKSILLLFLNTVRMEKQVLTPKRQMYVLTFLNRKLVSNMMDTRLAHHPIDDESTQIRGRKPSVPRHSWCVDWL